MSAFRGTPATTNQTEEKQRHVFSYKLPPLPLLAEEREAEEAARLKAETILRKLTPQELEGIKTRLGLDDSLEGVDNIIDQAVPILVAKILARQVQSERMEQESNYPETGTAELNGNPSGAPLGSNGYPSDDVNAPSGPTPRSSAAADDDSVKSEPHLTRPQEEASKGEWVAIGTDGEERGWVGEKGNRRWVGPPGEKPPRQRRVDREAEVPLAPGERAYFATCPRCVERCQCLN